MSAAMPGRGSISARTSEPITVGVEDGARRHDISGAAADGVPAFARQPSDPELAAPSEKIGSGWGLPAALLGLGTAVLLALFWPTAWSLGYTWATSNAFGHGFLIVPISAYLAWLRRHELAKVGARPSAWGIALVGAAAFAWLLGELAGASVVRQLALVAMLQGLTLGVLGARATRIVLFPLLYLYFAIPLGVDLIPPLQDFTAEFIVRLLRLAGVPVYLDGVFIQIPNARFEVAEACAGLRFLITSLALGTLFAYIMYRQMWRRVMFVSLSIVVPIIANGFRATGIVMLAHVSDQRLAAGADHITYGLIFLSIVLIALLGLGMTFREREPAPAPTVEAEAPSIAGAAPFGFVAAFALALAMAGGAVAYSDYIARGGTTVDGGGAIALSPPPVNAPWARAATTEGTWRPTFASADAEVLQTYQGPRGRVDLYIAFYARQRQGAEAINARNSVVGARPWNRAGGGRATITVDGKALDVAQTRILGPGGGRLVWHWYWVDGRFTSNRYIAKFLEVKAKLLAGKTAAAAIVLAADYRDRPRDAARVLRDFLARMDPLGDALARVAP